MKFIFMHIKIDIISFICLYKKISSFNFNYIEKLKHKFLYSQSNK